MRQTHLSAWIEFGSPRSGHGAPTAAAPAGRASASAAAGEPRRAPGATAKGGPSTTAAVVESPAATAQQPSAQLQSQQQQQAAEQQQAPAAVLSGLSFDGYLSVVSALTRGNADGVAREVSAVEEVRGGWAGGFRLGHAQHALNNWAVNAWVGGTAGCNAAAVACPAGCSHML